MPSSPQPMEIPHRASLGDLTLWEGDLHLPLKLLGCRELALELWRRFPGPAKTAYPQTGPPIPPKHFGGGEHVPVPLTVVPFSVDPL